MNNLKRRVATMQSLLASSVVSGTTSYPKIRVELTEAENVQTVSKEKRRHLLQILHLTRALDSTLAEFTDYYDCKGQKPTLGAYLRNLTNHCSPLINKLPEASRKRYQKAIVDKRNNYMHNAGEFPANSHEITVLLQEMSTCMAEVLALKV